MFSIAFVINVAEMENAEVQQLYMKEQRIERRKLREASNPLDLPQNLFQKYYRVNKPAFKYLLDVLTTNIQPKRKSFGVSPLIKLSAALRFFAEGGYQTGIGKDCDVSVAQGSLSKVLTEVINVFEEHLCPRWITFCRTDEEKRKTALSLYIKHGIPSVIGCVDGTHVRIIAPSNNKHLYYNRKGFYSLNVMLVDPLTVIENKYIFEDECSNVKKVNEEHIVHSDNSDSSATVYELDIISDVESENKYDEEVSDSDSDIEKTVKKEDTGKNKDVSEFMKSKQNVKLLISAYRNKPFLWNKNSALLKNKPERQKCLEQIAEEIKEQCSSDINWKLIANTIKILCKNYRADIKSAKEKESCKGNVKYIPSWYFNDLHFLRPFVENSLISKLDLHLPDLSRNQIIQILELYKGYPHLWNTHIIEYYCKNKRSAAKLGMLESMETSMGIQISELTLEYYFRTIHNFFTQAKSKKLDSKKGGEEAASKLNNQHVYYEKLIFLYDHVGKFKCSECPRTCKTSIYLKLHKTQLHGSDPLVCTLCNKEFKAANAYINHAKRHMADFHHECKECGKKFLHPSDLRIHMRNHSGVKPFCCEICGASFRHYQGFSIHRRRHEKNYLYTCNICNKGYYTKGRYNYHMNAHSYNRLQTCIVCGKTFLSKKPLKQNVVIHEGSKSSTCKQCLKQESIQHKKAKYGEKSTVNKG